MLSSHVYVLLTVYVSFLLCPYYIQCMESLWLCLVQVIQVMMLYCLWAITYVARSWLQMRNMYAAPVWLILYDERIFLSFILMQLWPRNSSVHHMWLVVQWYCNTCIVVIWRKILWIPLHDPHIAEYCTLWLWLINPTDRGPLAHCNHMYSSFYTHMTICPLYSIAVFILIVHYSWCLILGHYMIHSSWFWRDRYTTLIIIMMIWMH